MADEVHEKAWKPARTIQVRSIIHTSSGFLFHFVRTAHVECFLFALFSWAVCITQQCILGYKNMWAWNYNHPNRVLALFPQSRMGRLRPLLFCTAVLRAPIASGHDECTDRRSKLVSHSSHQGSLGPLKATKYNMKTFTLACIHLSRAQTGRGSLAHFHSSLPWVSLREVELPCRD